jgi:hypothetical protein
MLGSNIYRYKINLPRFRTSVSRIARLLLHQTARCIMIIIIIIIIIIIRTTLIKAAPGSVVG